MTTEQIGSMILAGIGMIFVYCVGLYCAKQQGRDEMLRELAKLSDDDPVAFDALIANERYRIVEEKIQQLDY